jgi:WD40 repeat protein
MIPAQGGFCRAVVLVVIAWTLPWDRSPAQAADPRRPELLLPLGHSQDITSVALSEDSRLVLTGSWDNTARLWDVQTGLTLQTFSGHAREIRSVALSSDGRRVLTGSMDDTARQWDAATGQVLRTFTGHTLGIDSVALSNDGRRMLTGSGDTTARLWDVETGKTLQTFSGHERSVTAVALSADGQRVLTGSLDKTARLWDVETGKTLQTFSGHTSELTSVALSGDGRRALTGCEDQSARLWDVQTSKSLKTFTGTGPFGASSVALSGDGRRALTGGWKRARLWDTETRKVLQTFDPDPVWGALLTGPLFHTLSGEAAYVAWNKDGRRVLTGGQSRAQLWDGETGMPLQTFTSRATSRRCMALCADGRRVLTTAKYNTARLWDLGTGKTLQTFKGHPLDITSVALSIDGRRALTGSMDTTARLWDVETGKILRTFTGHTDFITSVALSVDRRRVLTGSFDKTARLWDAETGKTLQTFKGHLYSITSVALSADGRRVLTGSDDATARLWDAETGKTVKTFSGNSMPVQTVALSADGQRVLTGSGGATARLWDAETGQILQTFKGHTYPQWVTSVALSGEEPWVLTGSGDMTARLWDAKTGKTLQTFSGHTGIVRQAVFAPDRSFLITGAEDGTIRVWKPDHAQPLFSVLHAGDEWIYWTPEGYYQCSPNGENLIAWKVHDEGSQDSRVVGPEQFRKTFHRPDLFRHLLTELDLEKALAKADKERGRRPGTVALIEDYLPPTVNIAQPTRSGLTLREEECEIIAKANPVGDNGVLAMQLLIDDRQPADHHKRGRFVMTDPNARPSTSTWKVKLTPGEHKIQVAVEGVKGTTSRSEIVTITRVDRKAALPKLFLLSVGVTDYEKVDRKGAEFCVADAQLFLDTQTRHGKGLYGDPQVFQLAGGKPARKAILDAFEDLAAATKKEEKPVTMIFLAGHGTRNQGSYYFLCQDSDHQRLRSTAISGVELKDALANIMGRVIVYLDTCHSGVLAGDSHRDPGLSEDLVDELTSADCGVVMVCSSRGKEESLQDAKRQGGHFTLALVEAISGKAGANSRTGAIYLPEVVAYVKMSVQKSTGDKQNPFAKDVEKLSELPLTKP